MRLYFARKRKIEESVTWYRGSPEGREIASVEKVTRDAIVVVAREVVEEIGAYIVSGGGRRIPKNRVGAPNSVCGIGFDGKEAAKALFDGVRARLAECDKKAQKLRGVLSLPVREEDNIG